MLASDPERVEKESGVRSWAWWDTAEGFYIKAVMEFGLYFRKIILAVVLNLD